MDLVIEDDSRVDTVYFMMDEEDVKRNIALPWVSFGSDAPSESPEGVFLLANTHPRTYGNVARLLGQVRARRKSDPAHRGHSQADVAAGREPGIGDRGLLRTGFMADVAVFDPARIQDHATYEDSHRYATGMQHVFVNGTQVLAHGEHTGAKPGRAVWGRGRKMRNAK